MNDGRRRQTVLSVKSGESIEIKNDKEGQVTTKIAYKNSLSQGEVIVHQKRHVRDRITLRITNNWRITHVQCLVTQYFKSLYNGNNACRSEKDSLKLETVQRNFYGALTRVTFSELII